MWMKSNEGLVSKHLIRKDKFCNPDKLRFFFLFLTTRQSFKSMTETIRTHVKRLKQCYLRTFKAIGKKKKLGRGIMQSTHSKLKGLTIMCPRGQLHLDSPLPLRLHLSAEGSCIPSCFDQRGVRSINNSAVRLNRPHKSCKHIHPEIRRWARVGSAPREAAGGLIRAFFDADAAFTRTFSQQCDITAV